MKEFKVGDKIVFARELTVYIKGKHCQLKGAKGIIDSLIPQFQAAWVILYLGNGITYFMDVFLSSLEHDNHILTVKEWKEIKK